MAIIRKFSINQPEITALVADSVNNFVWLAYAQSGTTCTLQRVCATDFTQIYMSTTITCEAIVDLWIDTTNGYIFVLLEGAPNGLLAIRYSLFSTLNPVYYYQPYGARQPVAMVNDPTNTSVYILIPSTSGGNNGYILHYYTSGTYIETINFATIVPFGFTIMDESSMTIDQEDNIWIVTNTNPVLLIRVWIASGGPWHMQIHSIV